MQLIPPVLTSPWFVGNVLGSSGSVVPLFRRQIRPVDRSPYSPRDYPVLHDYPGGGPLVLQASALAQGGDLFPLDMGEPVRIKALAQMVRLDGLSLKDVKHPNGDIEIVCTGR